MRGLRYLVVAGLCWALSACQTSSDVGDDSALLGRQVKIGDAVYQAQTWSQLPGWENQDMGELANALTRNCVALMRPRTYPNSADPQAWRDFCAKLKNVDLGSKSDLLTFLQKELQPWSLTKSGMSTGYYEPVISGSLTRDDTHQWPLYSVPEDLLHDPIPGLSEQNKRLRSKRVNGKIVAYDTRAQFEARKVKPPAVAWLDDPIEAFFLQVQGSGKIQLADGSMVQLSYADGNGWPYTSIGKVLIEQGQLQPGKATMQDIKAWAGMNPERVQALLNYNESMVFFTATPVHDSRIGPTGAYGTSLVAQRAIAVDPNHTPLGLPVYVSTTWPNTEKPLNQLVFSQDTGSAIKGVSRVDFFWGSGEEAGELAGRMKQAIQMWILWPKKAGLPRHKS